MRSIVQAVVAAGKEVIDGDDSALEASPSVTDRNEAASQGDADVVDELLSALRKLLSDQQRRIDLEREDAARTALRMAADDLEFMSTNSAYRAAYRKAAKLLRE